MGLLSYDSLSCNVEMFFNAVDDDDDDDEGGGVMTPVYQGA